MDGGARKAPWHLRTYARHQPQHKIQLQTWLTPPIRQQHIFSSSSSSALSSSLDQQDSTDPDFHPPTKRLRKLSVADSRNVPRCVAKPAPGKKALQMKKKTKCISQPQKRMLRKGRAAVEKPATNREESDLRDEDKENSIPEVKKSFIFGTPQNNFITKRRRPAGIANRCPPSSGKSIQSFFKQVRLTPLSLSRPAPSGKKILHSPGELRLAPLCIGRPSQSGRRADSSPREVYLVPINADHPPLSRQRNRNPTRKVRLKPCSSGSSADFQTLSRKRLTRRQARIAAATMASTFDSDNSPRRQPIRKPPLLSSTPSAQPESRPYRAPPSDSEVSFDANAEAGVLHSELHSFRSCCSDGHAASTHRSSPKGAPSSIFSNSKSEICVSHSTPGKSLLTQPIGKDNTQGTPSIFSISSEFFTPIADSPSQSIKKTLVCLERLSLGPYQTNPSFQPVVALNSDTVSRYILACKRNPTNNGHECRQSASYLNKSRSSLLVLDSDGSTSDESSGLTPSGNDTAQSITSLEVHDSAVRLQQQTDTSEQGLCRTLPSENTVGAGTGRKVCISGFSSKRWGNRTRTVDGTLKTNKTNMHLSFKNHHSNVSESKVYGLGWQKRKEIVTAMALGDSIHALKSVLSMDLLDDSFLNSSAVQNLSSSFCLQDKRHYARLRAALSLHKKKKVEIEAQTADQEVGHINTAAPSTPYSQCKPLGIFKTPAGQRLNMQLCTSKSSMCLLSPLTNTSFYGEVITDAEKVYEECMQDGPISFTSCISTQKMQKCVKIGEGVFGEVFRTISDDEHVALKIIPIEGCEKVNGEPQKSFGEILPEIIISKELSLLCEEKDNNTVGFIKLHSVHCVKGSYPKHLLQAWDKYDRDKGSENDRPDLFGTEQLFIILEFEFGGSDLENMKNELVSITSAKSILHQVTAALAVAEEALSFEHRDLHWGNILVKKTDRRTMEYTLKGSTFQIPTHNIETNIIDYTLSRLEKDGLTVFCDISADVELFQGEGDYQYEMYRSMKEENGNSWSEYHPHSNVLWLHYVADKLLNDMNYKRKPNNPSTRRTHKKLLNFHKEVLTFRSAQEVLNNSCLFQ